MIVKDKRERGETYLFKDIPVGSCFEINGEFFIRGYQIFFGEKNVPENIGMATNLETGEIMRTAFDSEVVPITGEIIVK